MKPLRIKFLTAILLLLHQRNALLHSTQLIAQPINMCCADLIFHEGVDTESIYARAVKSERRSMCASVLLVALRRGCVMLKAPTFSGKTSMLQLLAQTARSVPQIGKIYGVFRAATVSASQPFPEVWESQMGDSWGAATTSLASSPKRGSAGLHGSITLILIDSAQVLYDMAATGSGTSGAL